MDFRLLVCIAIGYLLGSIPFTHIIAKRVKGVNLQEVGSRNVGTRNLSRNVGFGWGALGGALDFGKGAAAMWIAAAIDAPYPLRLAAGTAAVVGHNWPVWLRFRGGKGLATAMGAGATVAFFPEWLIMFAVGWLTLQLSKGIILTAVAGFAAMLITLQLFGKPIEITYFVLSLAVVVLIAAIPDAIQKLRT